MTFRRGREVVVGLLHEALPVSTLVVAIDPGKVSDRVWLSTGEAGAVVPPLSLPVLGPGLDQLQRLVLEHAGPCAPVFAIEATGALHRAWVRELNLRFPRSVRLFAPSETAAARAQLGSRRFKTDDRDCAALTYLARQDQGRVVPDYTRGGRRFGEYLRSALQDRPEEHIRHVRVPVLAARGRHDHYSSQSWVDDLAAAAPAGRSWTLPGAHNVPYAHPGEVAHLVGLACGHDGV
jgi:pimeloyl-ACP methyl ester carboxylesterase